MGQASALKAALTLDAQADLDFSEFQSMPGSPVEEGNLGINDHTALLNHVTGQEDSEQYNAGQDDYESCDDHRENHQEDREHIQEDREDDPLSEEDEDGEAILLANGEKRRRLAPHLVRRLEAMNAGKLRSKTHKHQQYTRLVAEDKADLDEAHEEYQKHILRITCKNRLKLEVVEAYLGRGNRARGPNMYSNFCRYNIGARKVHANKSIKMCHRSRELGLLWHQLSEDEQRKYADPAFLANQPNPFLELEVENGQILPAMTDKSASGLRQLAKPSTFDATRWCEKVSTDMTNLANSHGVEGIVIAVYPTRNSRAIVTGGSKMGEAYVNILAANRNPCNDFLEFVIGQKACSRIRGVEQPVLKVARKPKAANGRMENCEHDKGSLKDNKDAIREQLGFAIYKASNHAWCNGWPGADTVNTMTKLKLILHVDENNLQVGPEEFCKPISNMSIGHTQRILTALGKGWVHILSRGPPNPTRTIGAVAEEGDDVDRGESSMRSLRVGPVPAGEGVPKNTSSQAAGKGKGKGARNKNQKGKGRQTKTRKKGGDGQSDDSDENETEKTSIALPEEEEVDDDADPNLDDDSQILPNAHQVERASTRGRRDRTTGTSQADQETTLPRLNKENRTIAALPRKVTQAAYTKTTKNTKESASTAPATAENEANAKAKGKRKRSVRIPPFDSQANRSENGGGKFHNGKWRPKKLSQSKSTTSTSPDPEERPRKELTIHVSSGSEDDSD
ncbi:hypothetical protein PSTG_17203 [Puccinia striiformis f. sp. tritici PST-78]|uniref:Uncharacterized protein n=2 Tax=Puccinia striiformis f. sp. tritici TaxID=168172 RepID=A0A0L0UQL7_9BASI|nr:hypothetical protein PSTG_17203 [Puccinia striiformis f. sp. tritici PST-78]